jgi:uncharacterized membrane protein YdjX (TVP38/TMEM64 family)
MATSKRLNALLSLLLLGVCVAATAIALAWSGRWDSEHLQTRLQATGLWAPIAYLILYTIATLLVLPSTALNLTGGAIFGPWWGVVWTSLGAILAAAIAFGVARTVGREAIARRLAGRWQAMDAEIRRGAIFYMFAVRLVPILPYGLVNFAAGLTSIRFRDYLLGTTIGTVPSVLPFVLLGSSGVEAMQTGRLGPLLGALALAGLLVGGSTWYRHRRDRTQPAPSNPADSKPTSSEPADSEPADSEPASSAPASSAPASSKPVNSTPAGSKPASSKPASSKPVNSAPASSERASSEPADSEPVDFDVGRPDTRAYHSPDP